MAKLAIHTTSGETVTAPFEAWVVALINALPPNVARDVFRRVSIMEGASLIPDKFQIVNDELGGITLVEKPVLDIGRIT